MKAFFFNHCDQLFVFLIQQLLQNIYEEFISKLTI